MSVVVKLEEVMAKREINCAELAEKIGIPAPDLSLLKTGKARAIKFTTISKLCQVLECKVEDILEYKKDLK